MKLRDQAVVVNAPRELCFEVVVAAGRRIENRSDKAWVVEFVTAAGGREVRTVELLTLDRPRAIHYRWLEGPLPDVNETISFATIDENTTRLAYRGAFSLGRGPLGWAIGLLRVKPLFDRLVGEHLQQAKEVAEKRAARSRVHARTNRLPEESLDE
ncbi:MAG: hypothetical protein H0U16_05725 [Actinobacteria bacterium]|nr:hypothetical protein [Actinomycetota bacterium]